MRAEPRPAAGSWPAWLLAGLFAALTAACAAQTLPAGPPVTQPRLLDDHWITADGLALPLRAWLPGDEPSAVILALHGFNDHSGAFAAPGEWWAERGIATYAYDQRGFGAAPHRGRWAGIETLVMDLETVAGLVRAHHPGRPLYLLGESMGGAVIMIALAAESPIEVDGAILAAPAVWGRSTMPAYQRAALWIAVRIIPWARLTGEAVDIQASDNIEMLRALGRDPLVIKRTRVDAVAGLTDLMDAALSRAAWLQAPALLLYGERDEVVPKAPTLRAWKDLPQRQNGRQRPALYEDGWHLLLRDLGAEVVLADVAAWIEHPDAPLPSGADRRARAALVDLAAPPEAD